MGELCTIYCITCLRGAVPGRSRVPVSENRAPRADRKEKDAMYAEDKVTDMEYLPLSCSQMNIWNLEMAYPGLPINNICTALRIEGNLNLEYLQSCIELSYQAFPSLRTRITVRDGVPCQYVSGEIPARTVIFDFTETNEQGVGSWFQSVAREHFTLCDAPLCQMLVFKTAENSGGILTRVHHIVADAWSHGLITNYIIHNYFQLLQNNTPDSTITPSYEEHILKEQKYLKSRAFEKDKKYWNEALRGISPGAAKEHQCAVVSPVGLRKSYRLPNRLNRLIGGFCEKTGVSPFAVFYMGLAIYLRRVKGQARFCIGVPTMNRLNFKEKQTGGMFVNTLPFVNEFDISITWNQFNEKLQRDWFALLYHQRIPYEFIKKIASSNEPHLSEGLFDIVLSYQNGKLDHLRGARVSLEGRWMYSGYQCESLCIHLSSRDKENQFMVDYDYLTQIFSEGEIDRLHESLCRILKETLQNPDTPIYSLSILSEEMEEKVIYDFNQTDVWYEKEGGIAKKLKDIVEMHPDRTAVIFRGRRISYRELGEDGENAARRITRKMNGEQGTVAIHLERSEKIFIALWGVIFSGNSWLLIDTGLPRQRKEEILRDSCAVLCICDSREEIHAGSTSFVLFDELAEPEEDIKCRAAGPDDLAYLVYTSGSTGTPKGVEVEQHSVLNLALSMHPLYPKGAVLSICNVGFDAFLLESVIALLDGRTIVFSAEDEMNHPQKIGQLIQNFDAGFLALTPSRLSAYLKEPQFCEALWHLETIICGGESLPPELYKKLSEYTGGILYNQYGPSEATVAVSHAVVNGKEPVSIGRPLCNCRMYILDEFLNPLPPGSAGEIYISGACLARGYHNRKELTEECFLQDPFLDRGRMYRTGDYGRWSEDGRVFYLGRQDSQIKLLGHRIELSEIESVLMRHPEVDAAAVTVWEEQLIAYYIGSGEVRESEILTFAANYLPRYLLPGVLMRVKSFSLTGNGKIDFQAMPKPVLPDIQEKAADEVEQQLLHIWKKVLGKEELGVNSDYFLVGGDSLNAVLMLLEVEDQFSRTISMQEFYANATLRRLGNLIRGREVQGQPRGEDIRKAAVRDWYPVTPSQAGFYVMHQLDETKISYNMPTAFLLSESLDFSRLEHAVEQMIQEDSVLRTTFHIENGRVTAKISSEPEFRMQYMECGTVKEAMENFVQPFNLEEGPLIRVASLKLPGDKACVLLDTHHIISDGLSSQILLGRLNRYYEGLPVSLPEFDYTDYAWWLSERAEGTKNPCREFWEKYLPDSLPESEFPLDRPRPAVFDGRGSRYSFELPESLHGELQRVCKEQHVTVFVLLLSIYGVLLSRYSGKKEVVIGTPFSGRHRQHMEKLTGVFVNSLPVFMQTDPEATFTQYLESVKNSVTAMLDNQEITLEELAKMAGAERSRAKNPLFSVMFTMTPLKSEKISIGNAELDYVPSDTHAVKMDLNLEVTFINGRYYFQFEYAKSLFDEVTIAFYSRCYLQGLQQILSGSDIRIQDIAMLDPADRIRLLEKPRHLRTPYDGTTVDQAADYYAFSEPERIAVQWGEDDSYTFRELKEKSDALAALLQKAGVEQGDKVAFLTRRTGALPVFMFGILKAGAAYVPVDPKFPRERILYMLQQAEVKLVLYGQQELVLGGLPCEEMIWKENHGDSSWQVVNRHGPEDAANVIYTSGTTGNPKGVVMLHKSLSNLSAHLEPLLGSTEEIILCASNCVFDVFTTETILSLGKGYAVSIADEEEMVLPWKMAERIQRDKVTILQLTPSRIQMCLGDEAFRNALHHIRRIILLGEPWSMELKDRLNSLTSARIFNIYGPTETSVHNCQGDITEEKSIHIGEPIGNCRYYLLDKEGRQVPPTAVGEIYIAGECLSRGYINQKELTDEVFLPDCYFKGEKMYKTGDLGRLRADGNWQCLGRVDTQIKLNGHRIEPLEIAEVMLESGLVKEAAVVPVMKNEIPLFLRGAVVKAPEYSEEALRAYMRKKLPEYMLPSEILILDELPRSASGKTDLKKLAAPADEVRSTQGEEDTIGDLWKEVLGRDALREVSFFEQGGTSLMAIVLLNRYHQKQYEFSINDFYHYPTLKEQETILGITPLQDTPVIRGDKAEQERPQIPEKLTVQEEKPCRPGAVFLTGATGYLGSYILKKLLEYGNEEIYCLIRKEAGRLEESMDFYFGKGYYKKYQSRLHVIVGELTKEQFQIGPAMYTEMIEKVTRVFHCAADVRHYAPESELYQTNVEGTREVLCFVKASKAALMHISTVSVAGDRLHNIEKEVVFEEGDLNIGQNWWDNPYVKSKILAEKLVDDAVREGICANIFRIGRLVGDSYNGIFQRCPESNAYYRLIKGILELGMLPEVLYAQSLEVTPVNLAAEAVIRLSNTTNAAYHIYSPHEVEIGTLANACIPVKQVDARAFERALEERSSQSNSPYIQALMQTWFSQKEHYAPVRISAERTLDKLASLDFWWPQADITRLRQCFLGERKEENQ
jgi:amino acid adenylation domain-containing protein/thioester reductase-like protein